MEVSDQLLLMAEVAVALAGFSGIVAMFQLRAGEKKSRGDIVGLISMVHLALLSALLAFLPLAMMNFGMVESVAWSASSGAAFILFGLYGIWFFPQAWKVQFRGISRMIFTCAWGLVFLCLIAWALNALKIGFDGEPGPYIASLLYVICFVGYMFTRLLFRPLRKKIQVEDAESSGKSTSS